MSKPKTKKIINTFTSVILVIFLAICVLALVSSFVMKNNNEGTVNIFGHQMLVVITNSMGKCDATDVSGYEIGSIPQGSMIFIQSVPKDKAAADEWYADLKKGDVLTFRYVYAQQITITHRITSIEEKEGGYIISLAGDNVNADTQDQLYQTIDTSRENDPNYVMGKVIWTSYPFGLVIGAFQRAIYAIFKE